MGRPPVGSVELTLEQLEWAVRAIRRRYDNQEMLKSDREQELVKSLNKKLEELSTSLTIPLVLRASRSEARFLQKIATELHKYLTLTALPGYHERATGKEKTRYLGYAAATEAKAKMLSDFLNKVKRSL